MVFREERVDRDVAVTVALAAHGAAVDVTVARGPDSHRVPLRGRTVPAVRAHVHADEGPGRCLRYPRGNELGEAKACGKLRRRPRSHVVTLCRSEVRIGIACRCK